MTGGLGPETHEALDLEALVPAARGRRRRGFAVVVALIAGVAVFGIARLAAGGAPAIVREPNGPTVNVRAFAQHGTLAFVSHRKLWVLDGRSGSVHALTVNGFTPTQPVFSADGKWLAYLEQHFDPVRQEAYSRLWIARANGSDARVVPGLQVFGLFGWSPSEDVIAIATGPINTRRCPCYSPTTVRLVAPNKSMRTLAHAGAVYGAAWSPGGRRLAVAAMGVNVARLVDYPTSGGPGRIWLVRHAPQRLNGMQSILFTIAGWWPHVGIGIWVFGNGMVHNNDQTPLDVVGSPGATPRLLGSTLSDGWTDATDASARGRLALVADGVGREAWRGKQVELCEATCQALPRPAGTVTVDPSWSPDGSTLAYAAAPNVTDSPWTQKAVAAWFNAHDVLLYDTRAKSARKLAAAHGATAVTWSRDGKSLLYVRNDGLWLLPTLEAKPVRIASTLFPFYRWPQYYAQVDWSAQFAWSSRRRRRRYATTRYT